MDQNSFSVFRHAPLLVDSGVYDDYNTSHWDNYYRRTIAHNSVVVFNPAEKFTQDGKVLSNDGGQWFKPDVAGKPGQIRYPTLAEIQAGKRNALDGVTHFEEGGRYAFVTGNASKAYSAKLDQTNGFLRSVVYLRPPAAGGKTSILVFDRVLTTGKLAATSLLHSVGKPATHASPIAELNAGGRVRLQPTPNNQPLLVRNQGGMVTIDPLLPKNARVVLAGGVADAKCDQIVLNDEQTVDDSDCRFMVRKAVGGNAFSWYNYAPKTVVTKKNLSDVGVWRMEFSAVDEGQAAPSDAQLFLNVLHVEEERPEADPASNSAVLLESTSTNTAAVAVDAATTVVFVKTPDAATSVRWKSSKEYTGSILVTGLLPLTAYLRTYDAATQETVMRTASATDAMALMTSKNGVLNIAAK
ncbi:heparinase II/III family protein [Rugamonas sp. DEMB1]|uniref:heparinase II/III domain-containing protein n=1 Tax=Rugamonas sp. DEMB1 TaxID=3039386 RepID=UPI00244B36E5|nr:heparinase II/III family protein [Rugamonas sp. DEMB1]WGG52701.1 heparinase II/III family protein [Rugamonas sp. DEMB1]